MFIQRGNNSFEIEIAVAPPFLNTYSTLFDGVDDYINLGSGLDIFGSDFTISLWAKWGAQTTNSNGLVNFASNTNKAVITLGFSTQYGKISFGTGTSSTVGILYDCGSGYDDTNWHHIMCTLQGSTRTVYVDGVDISSTGSTSSIGVGSNNDIGNRARSRYFVGNIDEVSVFDSVIPIGDVWDGSGLPTDLTSLSPNLWLRNGDNGAYKSPQWLLPNNENKDKVSNYSLSFDGVDDEVNCGSDSSLQNPNFTISVWVYPTSTSGTNVIVQNTTGTFGTASNGFRVVRVFGNYIFYIGDGSGNNAFQMSNAASLNTWQNIVMTYDGTNAKYYLDGVLQGTAAVSNISYGVAPYNNFYIGTKGGSQRFTGNIDEVALWDSALTDISSIYNGGEPTTISGAVAHWRMGEEATFSGGVWTVPDQVGSNDGTSNAMTIEDRVGDAPNSTSNSVSYNMDEVDRVEDTP